VGDDKRTPHQRRIAYTLYRNSEIGHIQMQHVLIHKTHQTEIETREDFPALKGLS